MEISKDFLEELNENYGISIDKIKSYYNRLISYPIVENGDLDLLLECLERVVQDASTNEFIKENNPNEVQKNLKYSISDALYNIYGDESLPYLDEDYIKQNQRRYAL